MSDELFDESDNSELSQLLEDSALWAEPSAMVEDTVIAAISAELKAHPQHPPAGRWADSGVDPGADPGGGPIVDLGEHRTRRAGGRRFWPLAAAAALLIIGGSAVAGFFSVRSAQNDETDWTVVAMAPTELAPGSSAIARIAERPNGAQMLIELSGLEPAPLGFFYEVWLVKDEPLTVISAGTFHMRGSDSGEIEFWAGVSHTVYPRVTVTLESEADPSAPGELILEGRVGAS